MKERGKRKREIKCDENNVFSVVLFVVRGILIRVNVTKCCVKESCTRRASRRCGGQTDGMAVRLRARYDARSGRARPVN